MSLRRRALWNSSRPSSSTTLRPAGQCSRISRNWRSCSAISAVRCPSRAPGSSSSTGAMVPSSDIAISTDLPRPPPGLWRGSLAQCKACRYAVRRRPPSTVAALPWCRNAGLGYPALMPAFICTACGTQYPPSEAPPGACPVCTDERQFVPASGQSWTTLEALRRTHSNKFRRLAAGLTTIETTPAFAIGQRAILAQTPAGNVLWDCIALVDDATVDLLQGLGGVKAIAISHPHYYTTMAEWSRALGGVPIHLHAADREWVMRADPAVQFWEGDTKPLGPGLTLVRLGGHFDGGTVLHWADWNEGRGVVLAGDILQVVPSRHVSFMWSYPNLIPLSAAKVRRMAEILEPFAFDAVYGAFSGRGQIDANGKAVVAASVARYVARISET